MKVDIGKILLMVGVAAFLVWMLLMSICAVDSWETRELIMTRLNRIYDILLNITIDPQVMPYVVPERDTEDILGIKQISLSDETKALVEDLRWKHYPSWVMDDITDEWWIQQYSYIEFKDGTLYIVDGDVTWFIEMTKVVE